MTSRKRSMPATSAVKDDTQSGEDLLTVSEVAKLWKVSETTVERERKDGNLPATKQGNAYRYRRSDALIVGAGRHVPVAANQRDTYEGDRDARVFAAFNDGCSVDETVVRERIAVGTVARLHAAWMEARASKIAPCLHHGHGDCSGAPQPNTALCGFHAARTELLSDEQRLLLRGQVIPTAMQCGACHKTTAHGVCDTCLFAIRMDVEGEGRGRRIVLRIRDKIVGIIANEKAKMLARDILVEDAVIPIVPFPDVPSKPRVTDRPLPEGEELHDLLRSLGISNSDTDTK